MAITEKSKKRIEIEENLFPKIKDPDLLKKIEQELDIFQDTEGVEGKNNLDTIYDFWKRRKKPGVENVINSWVAYGLGFTTARPAGEFMKGRRIFARPSPPDVDTDFDDERRDDVVNYVVNKYGIENVGSVGTYMTLKMKAAVTRVSKATDAANAFHKGAKDCTSQNHELAQEISKTIPHSPTGVIKSHDESGKDIVIKTVEDAAKYLGDFKYYMQKYPEILRHAKRLEGIVSNNSIHASGVIISDIPLSRIAPKRQSKKGTATQYANEDLEQCGLMKFDFLAIAALTVIRDCVSMIDKNYGISLDIERLPLNDEVTYNLYRSGKLKGVFQFEGDGMQETAREINISEFKDIVACIALFRPGPMDSIPEYVSRKKGHKKVSYFHPSLEPLVKKYLEPTYGILCYQEQVMQVCNAIAGFTITDGYGVIKAVAKKKQHILDKYELQFENGAEANGVPREVAVQYWKQFIMPFANYGFNKAHSACYSYLSYQTAYLKANYPDEFYCSYLNVFMRRSIYKGAGNWVKVDVMERDAKKNGIVLSPRVLNHCGFEYTIVRKKDPSAGIENTEICPPICCLGLGEGAARNISENRPYNSLDQFAQKTDSSVVSSEALGYLIDAGFFGKDAKSPVAKQKFIDKFTIVRNDIKKAKSKGVPVGDLFDE